MRSRSFLGAVAGATAILFTSIAGCGSDSASGTSADPQELFEPGPYEIGYRELAISYSAAGTGESRELLLRVWYPAQPDSGAPQARYRVGGIVDVPAGMALDAPPVTEEAGLPFVVHSHGNGGEGLLAYPYGELMASHGWILVAPNHTGNTVLDSLAQPDPGSRTALDRPHDITAIIDEFESGLEGDPLSGMADTSAVFVFGHSLGGYTTFAASGADADYDAAAESCEGSMTAECEVLKDPENEAAYRAGFGDPRVVAIAPQAPAIGLLREGELADLGVPVMLMTGRLDQTTTQEESAEPSWAGINGPHDVWVEMPKGAHYSFITICYDLTPDLLMLIRPDAGSDGCGPNFIDAEEAIPVLAAYVLAFGRRHVLGETGWDAVLEGPPLGDEGDFVITLK